MINAAQSIFSLFYAIMWGALTNVWPRWRPFDWVMYKDGEERAINRSILSLVILNFFPISYFIFVYISLGKISLSQISSFELIAILIAIMFQPFALFGFYYIWVGVVQKWRNTFYPKYLWSKRSDSRRKRYSITQIDLNNEYGCKNIITGLVHLGIPALLAVILLVIYC